ncbi:hypothetical protein GGI19_000694 [Coemansia pectinata]|uniref:Uncharacterized protein n=1 Tax=Coemansia pectinata TaxID=1052879 RepID=A0A9W8LDX2_9FUNG|nr:hypothetical protein GGI19_000694 [Coemansia pectinata]
MTASELRAAALSSMRSRAAAPPGSSGSEVTAIYQPEPAILAGGFIEQGELVGYTSEGLPVSADSFSQHGAGLGLADNGFGRQTVMHNGLAVNVDMGASGSSKPDEDFEALLLQYQNSASGPTSTSDQTIISADAYGNMPDRSSYYDYDAGRTIYGLDRYSSPAPGPGFAGQVDRNMGYYYQGAQWPIPGLSYFPGPMPQQQQSEQSTFNMLNQYHMQLRMLMSPSPRQVPAQRLGTAESFAPERFGQQAYPSGPAGSSSLQLPAYADYGSYGAGATHSSAEPIHRPVAVRPTADDGLLSDGELESVSGDYEHGYIGMDSTAAIGAAGGTEIASQLDGHQDVEGIVKERISQMLKMKNPKLLQSSSFRALMLLLKCIRLDDPDVIYAAIKSAPTLVISELNVLSAEFGLGMITEACVTTLLDAESLHANLKLGAAEAVVMTGSLETPMAAQQVTDSVQSREDSWAHVPASDSETAEMETRPSSGGNESSTPISDMDTSSDVDYEDEPSPPRQPVFDNQSTESRSDARPMPPLSRETTPQFHARFSRSRAPSPPSAQPRTPRRLSFARQSPTPSGRETRARIGGSALSLHSGLSIGNSHLFSGTDQGWRVRSPQSRATPEPAQPMAESTVCASEADRLVVFLDDSHSDTDSSTGSEDDSADRARDKARRLENRMINKECLRLAQEDELASQGLDGSGRHSASGSAPRMATPGDLAKASSEALLKTQENIRTQEAAIARLKMEITRKQTKMLLRKKLHESKLKRAHIEATASTAPATPYADESGDASPEQSTADSPGFHESASSLSLSSASGSFALGIQLGEGSVDASRPTASAPCSPSHDEARNGKSPMDLGGDISASAESIKALPECGPCEQMILQAPPEIRSAHISNIMALLQGAIQSKNSELRSIMRGAGSMTQKDSDKLRLSARQIDERLLARQTKLEEQKRNVAKRISELQAELGLVDMELDILSYSQAANRGYRAMIDPKASGKAPSAMTTGSRAVSLRNDITAVHQFMDLMFRAADTSAEATASDNDLALQASKMALVPPSLPPTKSLPLNAPPRPQRELGALRAKLVAMKQEQASMSQKLAHLAEKRKGSESGELASPGTKRPRADPNPSIGSPASATPPLSATGSSLTTSIEALLGMVNRTAATHGEQAALKWRNLLRMPADECIIQQLVIVDGVGLQCATGLSEGLLSGITSSEPADAQPVPNQPAEAVVSSVVAPAYVPYESPFGTTASASISFAVQSSETNLSEPSLVDDSIDLSKVSSANLFGLVKSWPESNSRVATQFHQDIVHALEQVEKAPDGTAPNEAIARALLPVVAGYRRMIPKLHVSNSCALTRALKTDAKSKIAGPFVRFAGGVDNEVLQINDISNLKRFVAEVAGFVPILNRDVARMSYSALAARLQQRQQQRQPNAAPPRRYFDVSPVDVGQSTIPGSASDEDDDNDSELYVGAAESSSTHMAGVEAGQISGDDAGESETEVTSTDDGPDMRYRRALRLLWHGCPVTGTHINETHVLSYLHSTANKSLGNALVYLKQSLQLYPRSEKLWDLCLELFARQPVAAQEVMAAFHDATKFNPHSTCLWQRYMHWCNWNITHNVNSLGDCAVWQSRLSLLTLSAVRNHVDQQQSPPAEHVSASLAKLILCFWEGLWALLELQITLSAQSGVAVKSALLKSQLISRMSACLWAKTPMMLYTQISGTTENGNLQGGVNRNGDELALARLLLPHHFMYVGLVFLNCFVTGSFVPQSVLTHIQATLSTSPGHPTTAHYLSPKMIVDLLPVASNRDGTLMQHIVDIISKFFAALIALLHSYDLAEPAEPPNPAIAHSRIICDASINLTLAQLERCLPAGSPSLCNGCEGLLYRVSRDHLDTLEPRGLLAQAASHGIDKLLLSTRIMPKCELDRNSYTSCERVVHLLREHALVVAKDLKVAPSTAQAIPWHASVVNDDKSVLKRLHRRISDCRTLYYLILGYKGPAQPTSMETLVLGLVYRTKKGGAGRRRHLLHCSGLWINIGIVELLTARFSSDSRSVDIQAVDSALLWMHYGLKHHVTGEFGARIQMWTAILQVTMVKRPLTMKDIVQVHRDLGYDADSDALHSPVTDFTPINNVLGPVIKAASGITLEAISSYLTHIGYANTELAFR